MFYFVYVGGNRVTTITEIGDWTETVRQLDLDPLHPGSPEFLVYDGSN